MIPCIDVDECQLPGACGSEHVCNNTFGSYACECPLGYVADSGPQNPLDPVCVGEYLNLIFYSPNVVAVRLEIVGVKSGNLFGSEDLIRLSKLLLSNCRSASVNVTLKTNVVSDTLLKKESNRQEKRREQMYTVSSTGMRLNVPGKNKLVCSKFHFIASSK